MSVLISSAAARRTAGFTLIEVMVALAVVAIALPALLFSLHQQVDGTAHLRNKSIAQMVAANKLVEVRIEARARQNLLKGKDSGVVEMGQREWHWWLAATATEVSGFYRVEINVAESEERQNSPLFTLVAFLSADLNTGSAASAG